MICFVYHLISFLCFDISVSYRYYINNRFLTLTLNQQYFFCLKLEGINLSPSISSSSFVLEFVFCEVFETFVISSAILFSIKSPVASAFCESPFLKQF